MILTLKAGYNTKRERFETSHRDFIDQLKNPDEMLEVKLNLETDDIRWIGHELDGLRKKRNEADYDGVVNISEKDAKNCILKAKSILALFN